MAEEKKWAMFLNEYCCKANPYTGNRPCDDGQPCDMCNSDFMQELFENTKNKPKEKVFVIYYFLSNDESGEIFQSIFRTQEEVDSFLKNYKDAIDLFEVREDYRHIIY